MALDPCITQLQRSISYLEDLTKQSVDDPMVSALQAELAQMKVALSGLAEKMQELSLFRGMVATLRKENERLNFTLKQGGSNSIPQESIKKIQALTEENEHLAEENEQLKKSSRFPIHAGNISNTTVLPIVFDKTAPDFFDDSDEISPTTLGDSRDLEPTKGMSTSALFGDKLIPPTSPLKPPTSSLLSENNTYANEQNLAESSPNTAHAPETKWISSSEASRLLQQEPSEIENLVTNGELESRIDGDIVEYSLRDIVRIRNKNMETETITLNKKQTFKPIRRRRE